MTKTTPTRVIERPASLKRLEALTHMNFGRSAGNARVYIVLDYSGSMGEGRKMQQAKSGARAFAESAIKKGYSVGLIQFASTPFHALSPQTETSGIRSALDAWVPGGSTDMTAAILLTIEKLEDFHGTKVMCIVTDGEPDHQEATRLAARKAKRARIDIMAIGTDDADRAFLSKLTTRRDLAVTAKSDEFEHAISSMAVCLPAPRR